MSGMDMLLKSFGIDPNQIKQEIGTLVAHVETMAKAVASNETRLAHLESVVYSMANQIADIHAFIVPATGMNPADFNQTMPVATHDPVSVVDLRPIDIIPSLNGYTMDAVKSVQIGREFK